MNLHDFIDELCDVLDIETEVDEGLLGDLAVAARDNVGPAAAPVAAYLLGFAAGASEASPEDVEALAGRAQTLAEGWDRPATAPDPVELVDDEIPDDSGVDHTSDDYDEWARA